MGKVRSTIKFFGSSQRRISPLFGLFILCYLLGLFGIAYLIDGLLPKALRIADEVFKIFIK